MIVVADASPLNYLVLVGQAEILHSLYGSVCIPIEVLDELRHGGSPEAVKLWATNLPVWISVERCSVNDYHGLDLGESAAITLALNLKAPLLVDERLARSVATNLKLEIIGTIGIIAAAHMAELLNFDTTLFALSLTNFRVSPEVLKLVREKLKAAKEEVGQDPLPG